MPARSSPRHAPNWLARDRVSRIVGLLVLLTLPHLAWLPYWVSGLFALTAIWRVAMARQGHTLRPRLLLHLMTVGGVAGVLLEYGGLNGQQPGLALLVVMTGLKLLETRTERDCRLLVFLGLLLTLGQLLNSQELPWVLWMGFAVLGSLSVLIDLQHPQALRPLPQNVKTASRIAIKALPVALLFFFLFPRIPGPLWAIPDDSHMGRTGLSDTMELGNLARLAQSDEVAFRVRFIGTTPPTRHMYWRAQALVHFDGERWTRRTFFAPPKLPLPPTAELSDPRVIKYEIQLEAHGRRYLPALDYLRGPLPRGTAMQADFGLISKAPVVDARLLKLQATIAEGIAPSIQPRWLSGTRQLPPELNPQTTAFAQSLRRQSTDDAHLIRQTLSYFQQEPFYYTLQPGRLTHANRVDEFLFQTRRGFCEHYAAAFVVIMRAAGIPARIVTGYQGAEQNGDYFIVRQSDAHAWAEVWLDSQGWVRIDPTAAVAPQRVERGLGAALPNSSLLPAFARGNRFTAAWIGRLGLQWDRLNEFWNRAVLAYGPELQKDFLNRFGLGELKAMLYALVLVIAFSGILFALQLSWKNRRKQPADPLAQLRNQLIRQAGINVPAQNLGPLGIRSALEEAQLWDPEIARILQHYQLLRYASRDLPREDERKALIRAIRRWKPQKSVM